MDPDGLQALPRRGRSQGRMGSTAEQWDGAPDPYTRARSPTRAATVAALGAEQAYGPDSRGDLMLRMAGDEQPAYFDDRAAGGYDAPRGDPRGGGSVRNGGTNAYGPPGRGGPPDGYGGGVPGGYGGWQGGAQAPPGAPGWQGGPPPGWQGGYGDPGAGGYGGAYRRAGPAAPEGASEEQWRQIQATLDKQNAAAAAAAQAKRPKAHVNPVRAYVSYGMRRLLYLIDSKIGTLKYQVLALIAVAVIISVSGGKVVQLVRDMAVEEGLLDPETVNTYSDGVWLAWSLIIDPGYGTWPDEVVGVRMRAVTVIIIIIGILYLSVIIALIVDAVQVKMEELKKARRRVRRGCACAELTPLPARLRAQGLSPVVEKGHTVVLGWAEQSLTIIRELASANSSEGGGVVAVLSDADKQDMERELYSFITEEELKGTKVVFRSGSRLRTSDMRTVAIEAARSIIIVSDVRLDPDTADAEVLQVVLNLTTLDLAAGCSVVAEVRDVDNEPLVMLVGGDLVKTVTSHDIIGRLMLLFVRQPGLARVYSSVLGFEGSEFYVEQWEALVGTRWRDVAVRFLDAVPIGVQRGKGDVLINPPPGYVFQRGDGLIVLAEDNDTYACEEPADIGPRRTFRAARERSMAPESVLFAGWRRDVAHMIRLLDRLAPPGSELHMLCTLTVAERNVQIAENGLDTASLTNLRVMHHVGNTAVKRHMDVPPLERLTSAIVLSDQGEESDMINSDSHCLATLLLIRGLQAARKSQNISMHGGSVGAMPRSGSATGIDMWQEGQATATSVPIVVEILDPRTQRTVNESYKVYSVADFIQSNEIISKARCVRARRFLRALAHCFNCCCADACHDQRGAVSEDDSGQPAGRHGHTAGGGTGGGLHCAGPGRLLPGAVTRVLHHAPTSPLRLHFRPHTCVFALRHARGAR